ncbi:MAG: glycosyltransferase [Candidatus Omnitrophota bacterium]|jgi:glycosyltransferase involved in cell wall biosynthesis|nr:MAG: glycosyltransferase [Candidatus Omnitrophota bacterium]
MRLSVVIPVYNEVNTIEEIIRRVETTPHEMEIIVIDDGSTDGTTQILKEIRTKKPHLCLIFKENNEGKGAAIRESIPFITGDYVVIQDADLEYFPEEYSRMLEILESNKADVVYGSRFLGPHRVHLFTHFLANKFLTMTCNVLFNTILSDMATGYKMFRSEIFKALPFRANGFGFDAEASGSIFRKKLRVYEVPISYDGRSHEDGKKIRWTDAFVMLYWLLRCRFTTIDIGEETLFRLSSVNKYYAIFFERVARLIGKRVLEIGSGNGNFTRFLMGRELVVATDCSNNHLHTIRRRFVQNDHFRIHFFDASQPPDEELSNHKVDTVICLNVLEHIEDDLNALKNMRALLVPGGRLLLLVPCIKALYGSLDIGLEHFRRYSRNELIERVRQAGFEIDDAFFFNMWGVPGWFVNSVVLRRKVLPKFQLYFFTLFHPLVKLERFFKTPFGLSVIAVARNPESDSIKDE